MCLQHRMLRRTHTITIMKMWLIWPQVESLQAVSVSVAQIVTLLNLTTAIYKGVRLQYSASIRKLARLFKSFKRRQKSAWSMSWWAAPLLTKKIEVLPWGTTSTLLKKNTVAHKSKWIILRCCRVKWSRCETITRKLSQRTSAWKACDSIPILCIRVDTADKAISIKIISLWVARRVATWRKAWSLTLALMQMKWAWITTTILIRVARWVFRGVKYFSSHNTPPWNITRYRKRLRIALKDKWERCSASKPKNGVNLSVKWPSNLVKWWAWPSLSTFVQMSWSITPQISTAFQ